MTGTFVVVGVVVGLLVGSFFNVVVYRTPRHLSVVRPGSFCPSCRAEIAAIENVPVLSWLWLRGRCRHCDKPISVRYPLVEAATAGVFAGIAATVRPLWGVPGWWALASTLGIAAVIDADGQACPPAVTVIGSSIGAVALVIGAGTAAHAGPVFTAGIGLAAGITAACLLTASQKVRENIGLGVIFLVAPFGACLGWLGLFAAVVGMAVALASVLVTWFVILQRKVSGRKVSGRTPYWAHIPFATCAACGLAAALLTAGLRS